MLQENPFQNQSSAQLASVLNQAPVAVIVSSAENRELLYANDVACRLFAQKEYRPGMTCYEAAGYEKPCPFCQCDRLSRTEFLVRNHFDNIRHRIYQLKGCLLYTSIGVRDDITMKIPPRGLMGNKKTSADIDGIWEFVGREIGGCEAAV